MKIYEGKLISKDTRIGIVVARFNEFITSKLLGGAIDTLKRHDVNEDSIDVAWVPGAWELLSGEVHRITISYAMRLQRELHRYHSRVIFLLCLALSRQKILNRQLSVLALRRATREVNVLRVQLR